MFGQIRINVTDSILDTRSFSLLMIYQLCKWDLQCWPENVLTLCCVLVPGSFHGQQEDHAQEGGVGTA